MSSKYRNLPEKQRTAVKLLVDARKKVLQEQQMAAEKRTSVSQDTYKRAAAEAAGVTPQQIMQMQNRLAGRQMPGKPLSGPTGESPGIPGGAERVTPQASDGK